MIILVAPLSNGRELSEQFHRSQYDHFDLQAKLILASMEGVEDDHARSIYLRGACASHAMREVHRDALWCLQAELN